MGEVKTEEQIARLVNEILQEPSKYKEEARLLLKLSVWYRQGGAYIDEARYEVVYGEADEVVLREWDEGYPYSRGKDIVLIPRTKLVVVVYTKVCDYDARWNTIRVVYVFTGSSWVAVPIQ